MEGSLTTVASGNKVTLNDVMPNERVDELVDAIRAQLMSSDPAPTSSMAARAPPAEVVP